MDVHGVFGHVQTFKAALERQLVSCPPEDRLALLLEATADVEREMLSTLRSSLIDLYEALSWKYASEAEVDRKRQFILAACEEQLVLLKRDYFPQLSKEHGLKEQYASSCMAPEHRTVLGYTRLADLEFAMMVWRQNLKRDLACSASKEDKQQLVRAAYIEAEALVKRRLNASHGAWNDLARQQLRRGSRSGSFGGGGGSGCAPYGGMRRSPSSRERMSFSDAPLGGDSIITVYERAMAQVWLRLEAIAQQHGVSDALQVFVKMDRAASHPMSFTQVAAAIQEVSNALQAGESPAVAETKAVQAAEAIGAEANNPDEEVSSIWPAKA